MGERKRRTGPIRERLLDYIAEGQLAAVPGSRLDGRPALDIANRVIDTGQSEGVLSQLELGRKVFFSGETGTTPNEMMQAFSRMATQGGSIMAAVGFAMSSPVNRWRRLFPTGPAEQATLDDDRAYFEANPERSSRIRASSASEAAVHPFPAVAAIRTAVINVQPDIGMRARFVYCCEPSSIEARLDLDDLSSGRIIVELSGYVTLANLNGIPPEAPMPRPAA